MSERVERSLAWHNAHGEYRVRYPDGLYSQRFTLEAAKDYVGLFGGDVVLDTGQSNSAQMKALAAKESAQ